MARRIGFADIGFDFDDDARGESGTCDARAPCRANRARRRASAWHRTRAARALQFQALERAFGGERHIRIGALAASVNARTTAASPENPNMSAMSRRMLDRHREARGKGRAPSTARDRGDTDGHRFQRIVPARTKYPKSCSRRTELERGVTAAQGARRRSVRSAPSAATSAARRGRWRARALRWPACARRYSSPRAALPTSRPTRHGRYPRDLQGQPARRVPSGGSSTGPINAWTAFGYCSRPSARIAAAPYRRFPGVDVFNQRVPERIAAGTIGLRAAPDRPSGRAMPPARWPRT